MDDIDLFIKEDLDEKGDITSDAILSDEKGTATIIARESGILAGINEAEDVFSRLGCNVITFMRDGDSIKTDDKIMEINGQVKQILAGERLALNFIGRMSGVASATRDLVERCKKKNQNIEIAATRKTTPGFRKYEKKAVKIGGGFPHRMGLYDGVLIKDNHLATVSMREAIRKSQKLGMSVEVEVETVEDAVIAAEEGVDIIMLDNMHPAKGKLTASRVKQINPNIKIEVSGRITPDNITNYTFADRISLGWITHSANNKDFSLDLKHIS